MKFYNYLNENKKIIITIKTLKEISDKQSFKSNIKNNIESLIDYWYEGNKRSVFYYLNMVANVCNEALNILKKKCPDKIIPYFDESNFIKQFFDYDVLLPESEKDLWPVTIYISSDRQDKMTIGLLVFKNEIIKEFEGNDEATTETLDLIDSILETGKELVTVFCTQEENLVRQIEKTKILPKGLYVSSDKKYAMGYWSTEQKRVMFSCKSEKSNFSRESEYDWKVKNDIKIKEFKYL